MPEKRQYHIAFKVSSGNKLTTKPATLKECKEYAEELSIGWESKAKSGYEWTMPNGIIIGIERAEYEQDQDLRCVSVFEDDEIEKKYDIRYFNEIELKNLDFTNQPDFMNRYIAEHDPDAYKFMISRIFSETSNMTIKEVREELQRYLLSRPAEYYQIELTESAREALSKEV